MATRKRSMPMPHSKQPMRGTSMEQRMNESGMIRAGSHPEFEKPTALDKAVSGARKVGGAVKRAIKHLPYSRPATRPAKSMPHERPAARPRKR